MADYFHIFRKNEIDNNAENKLKYLEENTD